MFLEFFIQHHLPIQGGLQRIIKKRQTIIEKPSCDFVSNTYCKLQNIPRIHIHFEVQYFIIKHITALQTLNSCTLYLLLPGTNLAVSTCDDKKPWPFLCVTWPGCNITPQGPAIGAMWRSHLAVFSGLFFYWSLFLVRA